MLTGFPAHTESRPRQWRGLLFIVAIGTVLGATPLLARPHRAFAQVNLLSSNVTDRATLDTEPGDIELTFDDRILGDPASSLTVYVNSRTVSMGEPQVDADTGTTLTIALRPETGAGQYVVSWAAAALSDGALASGSLSFIVQAARHPATDVRLAQVAHLPQTSTNASFAFSGVGTDANGGGLVRLDSIGTIILPTVTLQGVTPNSTFTVQLCSVTSDCTDMTDPMVTGTSSPSGTLAFEPSISFAYGAPGIGQVLVANTADANEVYLAQIVDMTGGDSVLTTAGHPDCAPAC